MSSSVFLPRVLLCVAAASLALPGAENVLVLTGASGSGTQIQIFSANPFNPQTTLTNVTPGAFLVITTPDGQKNYVIARSGGQGITVYDQNYTSGRIISGSINLAPTAAALSPDGRRLIVIAGNVYIFDTGTDQILNGSGFPLSGTNTDVAFAIDSSKAFVLGSNGFGGLITPIDLVTNTSGTPLTLAGTGSGIAMGPNGYLYVTTPNRLFEIDPRTLKVTPSGEIPVNANPGRPAFTPDGKYAVAINRTPITGSAVLLFDLTNHTVTSFPNFNVTLDTLFVAGNNRIYAYSSQTSTLYDITVQTGLNVNPSALQSVLPQVISSIALSNEIPARTMYAVAVNNGQTFLYKVDLTNNNILNQAPLPNTSGQVVIYSNPNPTSGATQITPYNANQTVPAGGTSAPLVTRVQDALGRPVGGARVDFTTTATGAVLTPATAFTNSDGYAQTFLTAPATGGQVVAVAAASPGTPGASFAITIPGGTGGGGGGGGSLAAITIVGGNGQLIPENFLSTQQMTVKVTDSQGNPAQAVPVTFSITQGKGTLSGSTSITVSTDQNGLAGTSFLATVVDPGFSFQQATVNAATTIGSVNFTITTVLQNLQGGGAAGAPAVVLLKPDFSTNPQRLLTGGAGVVLPGAIQVQVVVTSGPQSGQIIPNVGLTVGPNPGDDPKKVPSATCQNQPLTDASGIASCDVLLGNVLGRGAVRVNVGGLVDTAPVQVQITVGPPATVTKTSGDGQSGRPGERLGQVLRVRVSDSANNALQNVPLAWTVTQGQATLSATNTSTDINGGGQTTVTLGSQPGPVVIKVVAGSGANAPSATFNLTVNVTIGGMTIVGGNNQTAPVSQSFPQLLTVQVTDSQGNAINALPVTWTVQSGAASLSATSSNTDSTGRASISATAGGAAGPVTIVATAGSASATFNLTVRLPGPPIVASSFVNGASGAPGLVPCGVAIAQAPGLVPGVQGTVVANLIIGPLPLSLAGADLTVNGIPAPIYWVSSSAVAFQTPCEIAPGPATIVMRVSGGSTTVTGVPVTDVQPGIFETSFNGQRFAVVVDENGNYVTPQNPAVRGKQYRVYATGLGAVTPAAATGQIGSGGQSVIAPVTVGVANSGVRVISSEYLAGTVGVYVVKFEIPLDSSAGPAQNLALVATGADGNPVYATGSFIPVI